MREYTPAEQKAWEDFCEASGMNKQEPDTTHMRLKREAR